MFSARELDSLRRAQEAALDKTCVIRTTPEIEDNQGGVTPGTPVDTATVCRISVPTGDERLIAERIGQVIDVMITIPLAKGSAVLPQSQVLVPGSTPPFDTYNVIYANSEQSYALATRLACQRVS